MDSFFLNNILWKIELVSPNDQMLVDRTGTRTVGTTDPVTKTLYLANNLSEDFLLRVLVHELGHCAIISFGLTRDIHRMVRPECWIEAEEWLCNYLCDYGLIIFETAYKLYGKTAWKYIPYELERLIA